MRRLLVAYGLALLVALAMGCGSGGPDESDVLVSLTDSVISPGYVAAASAAGEMRRAIDGLCAAPSDDALNAARQAWRGAREPWLRTEAAWFGPVMDRRSVGLVDWPEVDPERIEAMLVNAPATTEDDVRNRLASTQRGFGAIEYLLFAPDALARLSDSSTPRCAYLTALGVAVASEIGAVAASWTQGLDGDPPYADFFNGRASSSLLTGQAVAELVRTQVFLVRTLVGLRLAPALGLREAGQDLTTIPGGAAQNALEDLRNEVMGMRAVYEGAGGDDALGVSDLVSELSTDTDERMRGHFADALAAIDAGDVPLRQAASEKSEAALAVYDRLRELQQTLNTEVVSLLGVSVGFSDTDGDSMR